MVSAMGKELVRFSCHHCGHCCTDVVCLPTPADVLRIVRATKRDPRRFLEFLTPDEIQGVTKSDPTWLQCGADRHMMALRRSEKGCTFLNKRNRHCTIYEERPLLCRLYPFKLHETRQNVFKGFSLHTDVGCPRNRDGEFKTQPLYSVYKQDAEHQLDYQQLVTVFNRKTYAGKKPADFLYLFVDVGQPCPWPEARKTSTRG
jgi:Fe-S-cluster containining protein